MKTAFLIHGYNGIPPLFKWLETELEQMEYKVITPEFPSKENINYNLWCNELDKYKEYFNKDSIVIGHSIGNSFILRYVYTNNIKINLFISLAGFCKKFTVNRKRQFK